MQLRIPVKESFLYTIVVCWCCCLLKCRRGSSSRCRSRRSRRRSGLSRRSIAHILILDQNFTIRDRIQPCNFLSQRSLCCSWDVVFRIAGQEFAMLVDSSVNLHWVVILMPAITADATAVADDTVSIRCVVESDKLHNIDECGYQALMQ